MMRYQIFNFEKLKYIVDFKLRILTNKGIAKRRKL